MCDIVQNFVQLFYYITNVVFSCGPNSYRFDVSNCYDNTLAKWYDDNDTILHCSSANSQLNRRKELRSVTVMIKSCRTDHSYDQDVR